MILAAHQPNLAPWFPYFSKIHQADVFISLINVQFEKNGWQNRCEVFGRKWTMPVKQGMQPIIVKEYMNGESLFEVNNLWIMAIAKTLGIDTKKIHLDFETSKRGTERIIELCKRYDCDQYLTNMDAVNKYLDEKMMNDSGIELIPFECSYNKHVFEAFHELGIEGTQKLLEKERKRCRV